MSIKPTDSSRVSPVTPAEPVRDRPADPPVTGLDQPGTKFQDAQSDAVTEPGSLLADMAEWEKPVRAKWDPLTLPSAIKEPCIR